MKNEQAANQRLTPEAQRNQVKVIRSPAAGELWDNLVKEVNSRRFRDSTGRLTDRLYWPCETMFLQDIANAAAKLIAAMEHTPVASEHGQGEWTPIGAFIDTGEGFGWPTENDGIAIAICRERNRALAELRAELKEAHKESGRAWGVATSDGAKLAIVVQQREELQKQLSQSEQDKERLDWLLSDSGRTWIHWRGERRPPRVVNRKAIDSARKQEKP